MLCRDVDQLLAEYAEDALPDARSAAVTSHLAHCASCTAELMQLRRSVAALNAAGRTAVPDLWGAMQARLAQEAVATDCAAIRELLPAFGDSELERPLVQRVRAHLDSCAPCAREERLQAVPLLALEQCLDALPAPDLWPGFAARLATTLTCADADELLPAYLSHEPIEQGVALRLHLEHCAPCAQTAAVHAGVLACIERVAHATPEVDLWPAFAQRLRQEEERTARRPSFARILATAVAWVRGPLFQPALGMAAFVAIAVIGHALTAPEHRPELARVIEPRVESQPQVAAVPPEGPALVRKARVPETAPVGAEHTVNQPAQTASTGATRHAAVPHDSIPVTPAPAQGIRVAFNLPSPGDNHELLPESAFAVHPVVPDVSADRVSERDGMAAVVQAVEILAGREDVLDRPFDIHVNE